MSHQPRELLQYANQDLMDDFNEFMIAVKVHLFGIPLGGYPKPTVPDIDLIQMKINIELKKDAKPMRKY